MDRSYEDAPEALILHWMSRRVPIPGRSGGLPASDADLSTFLSVRVPALTGREPPPANRLDQKIRDLQKELQGYSELALVNGLCIAHLRKEAWPEAAPVLFRRIWTEMAGPMLDELPVRWLISSAITFSTHGATEAERRLGQSLNVLFSLVKLYEFERSFSTHAPEQPFRALRRRRPALPMGLPSFALMQGKLDIEFLAPIWYEAETVPVIGPLALRLLTRLNEDPGTLFRRLQLMRAEVAAHRAAKAAAGEAGDEAGGDD